DSPEIAGMGLSTDLSALGEEGYAVEVISNGARKVTAIVGDTDLGILYGAFALLRHLQSHGPVEGLKLSAAPKIRHRVLNHWDNLDRSVERGYAGQSLWDWNALPDQLSPRYEDY